MNIPERMHREQPLLLTTCSYLTTIAFCEFIDIRRDLEEGIEINSDVLRWKLHMALLAVDTTAAYHEGCVL